MRVTARTDKSWKVGGASASFLHIASVSAVRSVHSSSCLNTSKGSKGFLGARLQFGGMSSWVYIPSEVESSQSLVNSKIMLQSSGGSLRRGLWLAEAGVGPGCAPASTLCPG